MTLVRILGGALAAVLMLAMTLTPASAAPIPSLEGRPLLADLAAGEHLIDSIPFTFPESFDEREHGVGLYVEPAGLPARILVELGEYWHDLGAFRAGDGYLMQVPVVELDTDGPNTFVFQDGDGNALALRRAVVFQLDDTFEQVHFPAAFAPRDFLGRRATPPLHSSQTQYDVTHYELSIDVTMNSTRQLSGTVRVHATSLVDNLATVALDFVSHGTLFINSVAADPPIVGMSHSLDTTNHWLLINFPVGSRPNTNDDFVLEITYSGSPSTTYTTAFGNPMYRYSTQPDSTPVISVFNQPYGARGWWPCKDVTFDKATLDFSITVPTAYQAVANGVLQGGAPVSVGGGKHRFDYSHGYPVATYLIAFVASNYEYFSATYTALDNVTTMPVEHFTYQNPNLNEQLAVNDTVDILERFAEYFGEYPFLDERYGNMTWGYSFGMEHQTSTSINNGDLATSLRGKSRRNIHEVAHQWFGDLVTPVDFEHAWLNEGWATWAEAFYRELDEGTASYQATIQGFITSGISNTTALVHSNADTLPGSVIYRKGGIVVHMLRWVMGDDAFFEGAREYLSRHALGNVDSEDLRDAMEFAHGASLQDFFDRWVYGIGRPVYTWSWYEDDDDLVVNIEQTQAGNAFPMPIEVRIDFSSGPSEFHRIEFVSKSQTSAIDLGGRSGVTNVAFDPNLWVYKGTVTLDNPPLAPTPTLLSVAPSGTDDLQVTWASGGGTTNGFEISVSSDAQSWTPAGSVGGATTTHVLTSGLPAGETRYVRVRATHAGGPPSIWTNVYGARRGGDSSVAVLIVEGFERWPSMNPSANHPWAAAHGAAIAAYPAGFATVANTAVSGLAQLQQYDAIVWSLGEESTAHRTFDAAEQTLVQNYLDGGGKLFVNGAEIGWDIGRAASTNASLTFFNNYLKASYAGDDSNSYTVNGTSAAFAGVSFTYGAHAYFPGWPDFYTAAGGGEVALQYATTTAAGVQFSGLFPSGTAPGAIVHFGFPFETIDDEADRNEVMERVLSFFGVAQESGPSSLSTWSLY